MNSDPLHVLVTGAAGYLGSLLTHRLLARGHTVVGIDRLDYGAESLLAIRDNPRFRLIAGDIADAKVTGEALSQCNAAVHLAAIVGDPACAKHPDEARRTNGDSTRQLMQLARDAGLKQFLYASTCSNYGVQDADSIANEESTLNPQSLYAELKVQGEQDLLALGADGWRPLVLRFATLFGLSPRPRFDLTVNDFTRAAFVEEKLLVYGEQFWRPYFHVADMAEALVLILETDPSKPSPHHIYNMADDRFNYQKRTIADEVLRQLPSTDLERVSVDSDPRSYRVSGARVSQDFGIVGTRDLAAGVSEIRQALSEGWFSNPMDGRYANI
jgi:nucleoside-diphosphate-sugar epimerase